MREQETRNDEDQITRLMKMETHKAFRLADKFRSRFKIDQEFGFSSRESAFFKMYFMRYCIAKTGYENHSILSNPLSDILTHIRFSGIDIDEIEKINTAKDRASEALKQILEDQARFVDVTGRDREISKIQNLANMLSSSFLECPQDSKRIKEEVARAKLRLR